MNAWHWLAFKVEVRFIFKVFGHHLVPFFYGGVDLPDQSVMAIAQTLSAVFGTRNKSVSIGL